MTAAGRWAAESAEEAFAAAVAPMDALLGAAGSMLRCKQKDTERLFVLLDLACHLSWALPRLMPLLQPVRAWGWGAVGFVRCWWVCARILSDGNERSHFSGACGSARFKSHQIGFCVRVLVCVHVLSLRV
jgi:hypothetical protein